MKIALVISTLGKGGAERVASVLASFFAREHDVSVIKFDTAQPFYPISDKVKIISTQSGVGEQGIIGNIKKRAGKIFALRNELKNGNFDIIISFLDNTNVLTLIANFGLKTPVIISEHTNHTFLKSPLWRALKRIFYPLSDGLSVLTKFDFEHYTYVPNRAILPNPMFEIPQNSATQKPKKENILLAAGRLNAYKGFDTLIVVLSLISHDVLKEWNVVIAGDGDERENLERLAQKHGVRVHFIGFVPDIQNYYARAKIIAVTSKMEGFCNILMESMFFDVARISTNCIAGPSELIENGVDGFLCEVGDVGEYAKKLEILMVDDVLRAGFVVKANERKDAYTTEAIGARWLEFIAKTLERKNG